MTTFTVADNAQLNSALASAKGGDTVVLQDGHYGNIRLTADYASTVTIRAEHHQAAKIGQLQVWGGSNMRFDGIDFDSGMNGGRGRGVVSIENGSQNIAIVNSEVTGSVDGVYLGHYGVYARNSSGITIQNNNIHDVEGGVTAWGIANLVVSGNVVDYVGHDVMKFSGLNNATISGNKSYGHVYPISSTVHNDFIQFEGNSNNVTIASNLYLPATIGHVQGIFIDDGYDQNFKIEDNIIYTGMLRGIHVTAGSGININHNTVLNIPGLTHNATKIFAPAGSSVNDNITGSSPGGTYGTNVNLQNSNPDAAYHVNDYFVNGTKGLGVTIQDLTPVAGSLAESKGATGLLKALVGGATATPAPSTPAPAPAEPDGDLAINAGGKAVGGFSADTFFFGGSTYASGAAIANTTDDAIYQTERYGNFRYSAAVEDGTYEVTLKFAELVWGSAGQRVFDVKAENRIVLDNYDIVREAGGKNAAVDETFQVAVTDGKLDLEFASVVENAKVSGIEIDLL